MFSISLPRERANFQEKYTWKNNPFFAPKINGLVQEEFQAIEHVERFYNQRIKISDAQWNGSCEIVNCMLFKVEEEFKRLAAESWPGIEIGRFVSQGSASQGLKVFMANEFDIVIPINHKDLTFSFKVNPPFFKYTNKLYKSMSIFVNQVDIS